MKRIEFVSRTGVLAASVLLVLLLCACGAGEKPEAMLASAKDYLAKNDFKAAIIQAKNVLQKDGNSAEGRYLLGVAMLRDGNPAGAEAELRKALSFDHPRELVALPLAQALLAQRQYKKLTDEYSDTELGSAADQAALKTVLATAYGAQGKPDLSRDALKAALVADPQNPAALLVQAREKATARDFDGALAIVESILARLPANYEAWKLKGDVIRYGKGQMDEALAAYRKAVEVKPDFAAGRAEVVKILMGQSKLDDAAGQLELMKKADPNSYQTKYLETLLAYQKKDPKRARELSQELVKLAPNNPLALQLAGAIELQADSLVQAEAYLGKTLQLAPQATLARRLLVTTYLRSNQGDKALAALQPLMKNESPDAATNALAGQVYLQSGDVKKAQQFLAEASRQDPKNTKTRTSLALTHLADGRDETGFTELQEIASAESGVTADLALISAHLRRREFDKALKAIDALEKKQADKPLPFGLRGRVLLAKNDLAGARKNFERALELDATHIPSAAALAALDLAEKKPDDARKRFESVLAKDPRNGKAMLALAELRARSGGAKEEVAELIRKAVNANPADMTARLLLVEYLLRNNDPKQALSAAQSAVAAIPENPELLDALGRSQQASGDLNQALVSYNKVVAMQPRSPLPLMRLANAHMAGKDRDAAAAALRKVLVIKPDFLDAQRGLMALALEGGRLAEALTLAGSVQKQRPKEVIGFLLEGDAQASQQKWDPAVEAYRRGLKQIASPELAAKLHLALGKLDKTAERDKFAATWLKDNPKDPGFRLYLADAALTAEDYAGAEKWYQNVIQVQPSNAVAFNNLAWVTGKLNKDGAVAYAEKAIALVPNQPAYADTLAMLLSEKNNYAQALEWENKALALQPENAVFRLNLAKIHIKGGKKDLARKELDVLAKLGDKFRGQTEVASLLKSL